jgi:hypothetical protein
VFEVCGKTEVEGVLDADLANTFLRARVPVGFSKCCGVKFVVWILFEVSGMDWIVFWVCVGVFQ